MSKINRFIMPRISKSMKGRGFTETFPSICVASVINGFMFGYIVLGHIKIEKRSLSGQQTNNRQVYVTPLRSSYFMSLHYKVKYLYINQCFE